ncbi:unnamed protein product [Periconia digitata]|uniref:Uncharacterized protein n=1 Tax=Periconia digitata TaxID=1303443 RepID=A0A9W4UM04_9PLEO|nr:unnamed protein product [Periconia digitata]
MKPATLANPSTNLYHVQYRAVSFYAPFSDPNTNKIPHSNLDIRKPSQNNPLPSQSSECDIENEDKMIENNFDNPGLVRITPHVHSRRAQCTSVNNHKPSLRSKANRCALQSINNQSIQADSQIMHPGGRISVRQPQYVLAPCRTR